MKQGEEKHVFLCDRCAYKVTCKLNKNSRGRTCQFFMERN